MKEKDDKNDVAIVCFEGGTILVAALISSFLPSYFLFFYFAFSVCVYLRVCVYIVEVFGAFSNFRCCHSIRSTRHAVAPHNHRLHFRSQKHFHYYYSFFFSFSLLFFSPIFISFRCVKNRREKCYLGFSFYGYLIARACFTFRRSSRYAVCSCKNNR